MTEDGEPPLTPESPFEPGRVGTGVDLQKPALVGCGVGCSVLLVLGIVLLVVLSVKTEEVWSWFMRVAHETLISNWDRLRGWLDEDRGFLLWRNRLRITLAEWDRGDHDRSLLLRSASLAEANKWLAQREDDLNPPEQSFIRPYSSQHPCRILFATHQEWRSHQR